jgi:hypothetical protein
MSLKKKKSEKLKIKSWEWLIASREATIGIILCVLEFNKWPDTLN